MHAHHMAVEASTASMPAAADPSMPAYEVGRRLHGAWPGEEVRFHPARMRTIFCIAQQ